MKTETQKKIGIGAIGLGALLAISLSYVGVKALTKPSVKSPTIIAQPLPAAEQNVAPPNQFPETAELTLTNPETEPGSTQSLAPGSEPPKELEPRTLGWQRTTTGWVRAVKGVKPPMIIAHPPAKPLVEREPATTEGEPADAIDRILAKLKSGNIAFNAPKTMNLHQTTVIQLVLGLKKSIEDLKQMIEAPGEKEGVRIQVSDRMEARLSGSDFAITANTPEIQAVSRNDVTEWKWEVKPSSSGRCYLHLTLSAFLSVDGVSTQRTIRTFDKMIEVEVRWHQRVGSFFERNWQWLWAAILVPITGWLWRRKKASTPEKHTTG
jgi:hypothetical protein